MGEPPRWMIRDNTGEYTSEVVSQMLSDMNIRHIPDIPYNSEENWIADRFNKTFMNAVRAALISSNMSWKYWTWALLDVVDKYNQLPHSSTRQTPHELWFDSPAPNLSNLFIFGQLGYVPVMNKTVRNMKFRDRGRLVWSLGRDNTRRIIVEITDDSILRHRGTDFHPYFTARDLTKTFQGTLRHPDFELNSEPELHVEDTEDTDPKDNLQGTALTSKDVNKYKAPIPKRIDPTTPNPPSRSKALRYPDRDLWSKSIKTPS